MAHLSIYLVKPAYQNPDDILKGRQALTPVDITVGGRHFGVLYVKQSVPKPPTWVPYFEGNERLAALSLQTLGSSAVLLASHKGLLYAIVFGYGRALIDVEKMEEQFGLKVTLNAIEPTAIRSIDHKQLDTARITREQLNTAAGIDQFGVDIERDLLRAVTGTPSDATLGNRLSGADRLSVVGKIPLSTLPDHLERYRALADDDKYREHFEWIDNIQALPPGRTADELDDLLAGRLANGDTEKVSLAVPEIVSWGNIAGFRFSTAIDSDPHDDLLLDLYLATKKSSALTKEALKRDHVYVVDSESDVPQATWSVRRCLTAEVEAGQDRYLLSDGKWYRIETNFFKRVTAFVAKLAATKTPLLAARPKENEGDYNLRAFQRGKGHFALMDKKLVKVVSRGSVEACDLYGADRAFLHVKHYGASSVLSHLFSQGRVSAVLFQREPAFRQGFCSLLPSTHSWKQPADPIRPSDFEVGFVVIMPPGRALSLPFFSQVNLRETAQALGSMGFKVTLTGVSTK